jgi:2'-5' RNA ligase
LLRTFVALELPPEVRHAVASAQDRSERAVRWVDPESAHLTIKFLGPTPEDAVPRIGEALASAARGVGRLRLSTAGVGRFPGALWLGLAGDLDRLTALREAIEREVSPLGWPTEARPFRPHLTLARRRPGAPLAKTLERVPSPVAFEVGEVSLMRSELTPGGVRYSRLLAVPL